MNSAIVVAAGSGSRFNSATPKQFIEINGTPMIVHTITAFERCPSINEVVLVLPEMNLAGSQELISRYGLAKVHKIVAGGEERVQSVSLGFDAVDPASDIVAVHDGARPLVATDEIVRTISAAEQSGAACLVAPVTDTIKEVADGRIIRTVDRSRLRRALTPQAFQYDVLKQALATRGLTADVTDECMLVEQIGLTVATVEGDPHNIKITHAADLTFAAAILMEREQRCSA